MLKALFFIPSDTGSAFYRVIQPARLLHQHGLALVAHVLPRGEDLDKVGEAIAWADVLVFSLVCSERRAELITRVREYGKRVIMDMDDDLFNLSPYSPHYVNLGLEECVHVTEDGREVKLWEDGKNIDLEKNRANKRWLEACLQAVDLITVSTPHLAKVYGEYNRTTVIPNYVDLTLWPRSGRVEYPGGAVRLAWRGGWSHYEDLMWVKRPLERLFERHDKLKLIMSGWCPQGFVAKLGEERVERYPFAGNALYVSHLAGLGADAAFYPWKPIPFNQGKTNLAWLEWSALGVPGVYPALSPYTEDIRHGDTGLVAMSEEGWFESLNRLVKDRNLRERIGRAARAEVEKKWDAQKHAHEYQTILEALCSISSLDRKPAPANSHTALN